MNRRFFPLLAAVAILWAGIPAFGQTWTTIDRVAVRKSSAPVPGSSSCLGRFVMFYDGSAGQTSIDGCRTWQLMSITATVTSLTVTGGHLVVGSSTAPTLAGCGTGATIIGSDNAGMVTTGTGPANCTVTFHGAFAHAPACSVTNIDDEVNQAYATNTTSLGLDAPPASRRFTYLCIGY